MKNLSYQTLHEHVKRVLLSENYVIGQVTESPWERGIWSCRWITCAGNQQPPFVAAYRLKFTISKPMVVRVHISADERCDLFLDGRRFGRGTERSDLQNWCYETFDLNLTAGKHTLVARVWSLGHKDLISPIAQMGYVHGFILNPDDKKFVSLLGTGHAKWEAKKLDGYGFLPPPMLGRLAGGSYAIDGNAFDWDFEKGLSKGWEKAVALHYGLDKSLRVDDTPSAQPPLLSLAHPPHHLRPSSLPPMVEKIIRVGRTRFVTKITNPNVEEIPIRENDSLENEMDKWDHLLHGLDAVTIPAKSGRRIIIDLEDYLCLYPRLSVSGGEGSRIRMHWFESPYLNPPKFDAGKFSHDKGHRGEIDGCYFVGKGDSFIAGGGRWKVFEPLWWRCGRYIELVIFTGKKPLRIDRLELRKTGYPYDFKGSFSSSNPQFVRLAEMCEKSLERASHETFMDTPYYEQLAYVGDSRIMALISYTLTMDARLPRKTIEQFANARTASGLTPSRYPSGARQLIPTFSLWWICMLHDYAMWRGDTAFVEKMMPTARGVMDYFNSQIDEKNLVRSPMGWNFVDWVESWTCGTPPGGAFAYNSSINWQFVIAADMMAELEEWLSEPEYAARNRRLATKVAMATDQAFWNATQNLYADDLEQAHFSQHAQCLGVLTGRIEPSKREKIAEQLFTRPDLAKASIYFTHYLFESARTLNHMEAFFSGLKLWHDLIDNGLKTTVESPDPTRSDCHAWGAHPYFHASASVAGIRPSAFGFKEISIRPQLGALSRVQATVPHPTGKVIVQLKRDHGKLVGKISIPKGATGNLYYANQKVQLTEGTQTIELNDPAV